MNILEGSKCFILDMDGTIYLGDKLIDGAHEFLAELPEHGFDYYFYTNNSSKNAAFYVRKLKGLGIDIPDTRLLISNEVIINYINATYPGKSVYLLGTDYLLDDFGRAGIPVSDDGTDIVVVGFDTTLSYARVDRACSLIRDGAVFLQVNPDFNCPTEYGFMPDCGAICAMITASTGVSPEYFGKPSRHTLDYIVNKTGYSESELIFVGDRMYTDIAIGHGTRAKTILVLSGESKVGDLEGSEVQPTLVCDSVKEILRTELNHSSIPSNV